MSICFIVSQSLSYASVPTQPTSPVAPISIPAELGSIEESFTGASGKTILYIQDAHDSLEAQENIAKIIHHLVENYGVKTVFEEGYEGPVPTDEFFSIFKDPQAKEKVSYFLMDKLRLGGAEYAHINRTKEFELIGVDGIKLHKEGIEWYKKSAEKREETEKDLEAIHKEIKILTNLYFPKELKEWMKLKDRLDIGQIGLLDYLKRIAKGNLEAYTNIGFLLAAESSQDKEVIEEAQNIDAKVFFEEIDRFENNYAGSYLTNPRDTKIFYIHKALNLLKRLNQIEITPEEFDLVRKALRELNTKKIAEFLFEVTNRPVILSNLWEKHIQNALRFYEIAEARDALLGKNLADYNESSDHEIVALIFGGFHKNQIKNILHKKNFSYLIITPKITEISQKHRDYYKKLMGTGHHSFETPIPLATATRALSTIERQDGLLGRINRVLNRFDTDWLNWDHALFELHLGKALEVSRQFYDDQSETFKSRFDSMSGLNRPTHRAELRATPIVKVMDEIMEQVQIDKDFIDALQTPQMVVHEIETMRSSFGSNIGALKKFLAEHDKPTPFQTDLRHRLARQMKIPREQIVFLSPEDVLAWSVVNNSSHILYLDSPSELSSKISVRGTQVAYADESGVELRVAIIRNDLPPFASVKTTVHEISHLQQSPMVWVYLPHELTRFIVEGFQHIREIEEIRRLKKNRKIGKAVREAIDTRVREIAAGSRLEALFFTQRSTDEKLEILLSHFNSYQTETRFVRELIKQIGKAPIETFFFGGDPSLFEQSLGPMRFEALSSLFEQWYDLLTLFTSHSDLSKAIVVSMTESVIFSDASWDTKKLKRFKWFISKLKKGLVSLIREHPRRLWTNDGVIETTHSVIRLTGEVMEKKITRKEALEKLEATLKVDPTMNDGPFKKRSEMRATPYEILDIPHDLFIEKTEAGIRQALLEAYGKKFLEIYSRVQAGVSGSSEMFFDLHRAMVFILNPGLRQQYENNPLAFEMKTKDGKDDRDTAREVYEGLLDLFSDISHDSQFLRDDSEKESKLLKAVYLLFEEIVEKRRMSLNMANILLITRTRIIKWLEEDRGLENPAIWERRMLTAFWQTAEKIESWKYYLEVTGVGTNLDRFIKTQKDWLKRRAMRSQPEQSSLVNAQSPDEQAWERIKSAFEIEAKRSASVTGLEIVEGVQKGNLLPLERFMDRLDPMHPEPQVPSTEFLSVLSHLHENVRRRQLSLETARELLELLFQRASQIHEAFLNNDNIEIAITLLMADWDEMIEENTGERVRPKDSGLDIAVYPDELSPEETFKIMLERFISSEDHVLGDDRPLSEWTDKEIFLRYVTDEYLDELFNFLNEHGDSAASPRSGALGTLVLIRRYLGHPWESSKIQTFIDKIFSRNMNEINTGLHFLGNYSEPGVTDTREVIDRLQRIVADDVEFETDISSIQSLALTVLQHNTHKIDPEYFKKIHEEKEKRPFRIDLLVPFSAMVFLPKRAAVAQAVNQRLGLSNITKVDWDWEYSYLINIVWFGANFGAHRYEDAADIPLSLASLFVKLLEQYGKKSIEMDEARKELFRMIPPRSEIRQIVIFDEGLKVPDREDVQNLQAKYIVPVDMDVFDALEPEQQKEFYKAMEIYSENKKVKFVFIVDVSGNRQRTSALNTVNELAKEYANVRVHLMTSTNIGMPLLDASEIQGHKLLPITKEGRGTVQAERLKKELTGSREVYWLKYLLHSKKTGLLMSAIKLLDSGQEDLVRLADGFTERNIPASLRSEIRSILMTYTAVTQSA